jgi:tetratricopeptide (TPR) repeat protein
MANELDIQQKGENTMLAGGLISGLVFAPHRPYWIRLNEYEYEMSMIADSPDEFQRFMVLTQAMQAQTLLNVNTQLSSIVSTNREILGIDRLAGFSMLSGAIQEGVSTLADAVQQGVSRLTDAIQEGFSSIAEEMREQNAILTNINRLLATKLAGEAREIRNSALAALHEGCSSKAFDREASLREALQLFHITVEHPLGLRDYVAWFNIGWLRWKLDGNLQEAEKAFATAVRQSMTEKNRFHAMAARHLAYIQFLQRKTDAAYRSIGLALQADSDPKTMFTQLLIAAQANNAAELTATFHTLITMHPDWLLECLLEETFSPYQAQLQEVVDAVVSEVRAQIKTIIINSRLGEAGEVDSFVRRELSMISPMTLLVVFSKRTGQVRSP